MFHWNLHKLLFQKGILLYTYMVTGYFASCIHTHTQGIITVGMQLVTRYNHVVLTKKH